MDRQWVLMGDKWGLAWLMPWGSGPQCRCDLMMSDLRWYFAMVMGGESMGLRLITMPGAEISALPMGICALVVGVLKARTSFLRVRSEYANHMEGQNFFSSAACLHPASVCILCGLQYINIYIYISACTLGDFFLWMFWVRSLLIKLELRDGLRWCCWSWCVLGPNQFLHHSPNPSTRWEDGPMESLGLYR